MGEIGFFVWEVGDGIVVLILYLVRWVVGDGGED